MTEAHLATAVNGWSLTSSFWHAFAGQLYLFLLPVYFKWRTVCPQWHVPVFKISCCIWNSSNLFSDWLFILQWKPLMLTNWVNCVFVQKFLPPTAKFYTYAPALPNFSSVDTARSLQVSNTRPRHTTCYKALGAVGALSNTTPLTVCAEANVWLLIGTADWA